LLLLQLQEEREPTSADLSNVKTRPDGDYNIKQLAQVINSASRNQLVLEAFLQHATLVTPRDCSNPQSGDVVSSRSQSSSSGAFSNTDSSSSSTRAPIDQGLQRAEGDSWREPGNKGEGMDKDEEEQYRLRRQAVRDSMVVLKRKKTLVFAVNIAHAIALQTVFTEAGKEWRACLAVGAQLHS
jgi:hypothetical protein